MPLAAPAWLKQSKTIHMESAEELGSPPVVAEAQTVSDLPVPLLPAATNADELADDSAPAAPVEVNQARAKDIESAKRPESSSDFVIRKRRSLTALPIPLVGAAANGDEQAEESASSAPMKVNQPEAMQIKHADPLESSSNPVTAKPHLTYWFAFCVGSCCN